MQAATKKLPVRAILFGILAGVVGTAVGLGVGIALGSVLAAALHVSPMEGEAGYFAVAIALIVALIATPSTILLTLYWRGIRGIWLFVGLIAVCLHDRRRYDCRIRSLVRGSAARSEFERADPPS